MRGWYAKIVLTYVKDAALSSRPARRNSPLIKTRLAGRAGPAAFTLAVLVATKCTTAHLCGVTVAGCARDAREAMLGFHDPIMPT